MPLTVKFFIQQSVQYLFELFRDFLASSTLSHFLTHFHFLLLGTIFLSSFASFSVFSWLSNQRPASCYVCHLYLCTWGAMARFDSFWHSTTRFSLHILIQMRHNVSVLWLLDFSPWLFSFANHGKKNVYIHLLKWENVKAQSIQIIWCLFKDKFPRNNFNFSFSHAYRKSTWAQSPSVNWIINCSWRQEIRHSVLKGGWRHNESGLRELLFPSCEK